MFTRQLPLPLFCNPNDTCRMVMYSQKICIVQDYCILTNIQFDLSWLHRRQDHLHNYTYFTHTCSTPLVPSLQPPIRSGIFEFGVFIFIRKHTHTTLFCCFIPLLFLHIAKDWVTPHSYSYTLK